MTGQERGRAGLRHSGVGVVGMPTSFGMPTCLVTEYIHVVMPFTGFEGS